MEDEQKFLISNLSHNLDYNEQNIDENNDDENLDLDENLDTNKELIYNEDNENQNGYKLFDEESQDSAVYEIEFKIFDKSQRNVFFIKFFNFSYDL